MSGQLRAKPSSQAIPKWDSAAAGRGTAQAFASGRQRAPRL